MIKIYEEFANTKLLIALKSGVKTEGEKFPGAINSYTIEAFMKDGMAIQSGTSHFLGQTFSKTFNIKYQTKNNDLQFVEQTS
jgi:prolyl-tRNA synthetase